MPKYSNEDFDTIRERIIGLGEHSARKSYYPELQKRIAELEEKQQLLMDMVRSLEEKETQLEEAITEKELVIQELHHRIKNNYQIIQSIMSLGLQNIRNPEEMQIYMKTRGRIEVMARMYVLQMERVQFSGIAVREIIEQVAEYYAYNKESTKFIIQYQSDLQKKISRPAKEPVLNIDDALYFALIINEVLSNCLEHAAKDNHVNIWVDLKQIGNILSLKIRDDGPGLKTEDLHKDTVGISLIDALSRQLHATWRYSPDAACGLFELQLESKI
ncbi:MAG: histidine kinase dimerization/phosphoacceptor domain -containing protein [Spirochaetota bacterium]